MGGGLFFFLVIYRHFSAFKKPWLLIQKGVFHLKSPKTDPKCFGGGRGVIRFMPTGCKFEDFVEIILLAVVLRVR
jgi:hypothetical protein